MKSIQRWSITLLTTAILLVSPGIMPLFTARATTAQPAPAAKGFVAENNWALCVGIGIYAENPEQDRPLMISEVTDFAQTLLDAGWLPDHVKVIKGEEGTERNILAGFRWLRQHEGSGDTSLVFLSTHGSPMATANGTPIDLPPKDEADGTDEMLLTYWQFAMPMTFLWDDEINVELNRLQSQGVCLIVDSCFAGGFNDHWSLGNHSLFKQAANQWVKGFGEDVKGQNRVILMGCREDEEAMSGGFAPWLIDGLRGYADANHDGVVTAEEAFNYTQPRAYEQTPTIYDGYAGELPLVTVPAHSQASTTVPLHPSVASLGTLESASVRGYVADAISLTPIAGAVVNIHGRTNGWEYFENETTTNASGFYEVGAPAGRYRLTISAVGYCDRSTNNFNLVDGQVKWINTTLYPKPEENATLCGYIRDESTSALIPGANVTVTWHGSSSQTYHNITVSNGVGFYVIHVASGTVDVSATKAGYFSESLHNINISDFEVRWVNLSMLAHPSENAKICGYVRDAASGAALPNAMLTYEWIDYAAGFSLQNETNTNSSGFYAISVPPGELYREVRVNGYESYDPYRHDGVANSTSWQNISLERSKPAIGVMQPLNALYVRNHRVVPMSRPIVFGSINVTVYFEDMWYGGGNVEKVEFYLDGVLKANASSQPYTWEWSAKSFGKHTLKVIAYDFDGDTDSKEFSVLKLL